jgi:hypothetical protein
MSIRVTMHDVRMNRLTCDYRCQQAVLIGNDDDNLAICDQCRYTFCKKCRLTYHSQTLCGKEVELLLLKRKERELNEQLAKLGMIPSDENHLLKEILAAGKIEMTTRLCPNMKCQVPIEKNDGCDHMYCTHCNLRFNWSEAKSSSTVGTQAVIEQYERELNRMQINIDKANQLDASQVIMPSISIRKLLLKRSKKCPNIHCGRFNIKDTNGNYLICQFCKRGYCFMCGQSVGNVVNHFRLTCKRHTNL